MNGPELLRVVEMIHRDKNIEKAIVFDGIEQAILSAARKHFGEEADVVVQIDRETGDVSASIDGDPLDAEEIGDLLGRIAAQTAKQVIIQKVREAEREGVFNEFKDRISELVNGIVRRYERGDLIVDLGRTEALLPHREQVPRENYRQGTGCAPTSPTCVWPPRGRQIILSRTHPGPAGGTVPH